MNLYQTVSCDPKINAQRNLMGRTHYVDPDTLKYHKARVLDSYVIDNGLLFGIVESVALDPQGHKRGFRPVVFDLFGRVRSRVALEHCTRTHRAAEKMLWQIVGALDAKKLTLQAIEEERTAYRDELNRLAAKVKAL